MKTLSVIKHHDTYGPVTWEYIGTVDAAHTAQGVGVHPRKVFTSWYYGVPRAETPGFGTTTWDVWVPRGKIGYSDAKIAKWQASCPHSFHKDALVLMERWEDLHKDKS